MRRREGRMHGRDSARRPPFRDHDVQHQRVGDRLGGAALEHGGHVCSPRSCVLGDLTLIASRNGSGDAGRVLRRQRAAGTVRNPRKEGRLALWALAD